MVSLSGGFASCDTKACYTFIENDWWKISSLLPQDPARTWAFRQWEKRPLPLGWPWEHHWQACRGSSELFLQPAGRLPAHWRMDGEGEELVEGGKGKELIEGGYSGVVRRLALYMGRERSE